MSLMSIEDLPEVPCYIVLSGRYNSRYLSNAEDYLYYWQSLRQACERFSVHCHAYSIMSHRVQILLTGGRAGAVAQVLLYLDQRHVKYVQRRYGRNNAAWDRVFLVNVAETQVALIARYRAIEWAPVGAGICSVPEDYSWSSYRWHAEGEYDPLVSDHPHFSNLGKNPIDTRRQYRNLFRSFSS